MNLRALVFLICVELLGDAEKRIDKPVEGESAGKQKRDPDEDDRHCVHHDFCLFVVALLRRELCLQKHQNSQ